MQSIRTENALRVVRSSLAAESGFRWLMTTRDFACDFSDSSTGAASLAAVVIERENLCAPVVIGRQVHGSHIALPEETSVECTESALRIPNTDGLVADCGRPLGVLTADCGAVAIFSSQSGVYGVAHSGWRSTAGFIAGKLVSKLVGLSGLPAREFKAVLSPAICGGCYEVGPEVIESIRSTIPYAGKMPWQQSEQGKFLLDVNAAIVIQLLSVGLQSENIELPTLCTYCESGLFFSYRRSADTCRMLTVLAPERI